MEDKEGSFKRSGAVPFSWEIEPGVPNRRITPPSYDTSLLKPPKKLTSLRLNPPSNQQPPSSSSSSSVSDNSRPISPFAAPSSSFTKSDSGNSLYFGRSRYSKPSDLKPPSGFKFYSSDLANPAIRWFPKSLFGLKKFKSDVGKKLRRRLPESEYSDESETISTSEEDCSQISVSTLWGSPMSFSSMKRSESDLSAYGRKPISFMENLLTGISKQRNRISKFGRIKRHRRR